MYLSVLTVIAGWAVLYESGRTGIYAAATLAAVHTMVVVYEEPVLERLFGEEYRAYRRSVGRWLPRLRGPRP
jgi:protein-S-isoprenylcysteine O-methyltransferase Ste14